MFYWWRQQRKMKRDPIGFIRQEFAFWGHDLNHITDDELKESFVKASKIMASTGFSAAQVISGMSALGASLRVNPIPDK